PANERSAVTYLGMFAPGSGVWAWETEARTREVLMRASVEVSEAAPTAAPASTNCLRVSLGGNLRGSFPIEVLLRARFYSERAPSTTRPYLLLPPRTVSPSRRTTLALPPWANVWPGTSRWAS